ncbi:hypothetical protein SCP_1702110 [Sparassis crispa]|uniref:Uncharacterized protein n=1 Tax=Sparassis crispa TaxID=139825 RepID=A0A401H614_9APHY|nr:hypothetical protein SCP_1702110 [Sparassis crispa]GBE89885.1 hypothetical protein SCP_1702110 [Sparassis crispa]
MVIALYQQDFLSAAGYASAFVFMGTRECSIVADTAVLVLTWVKTLQYRRAATRANARTAITTVLLKDGTVYFASLLFLNVFALGIGQLADLMAVMTTWTAALTSVLTSRFMLDLREAATAVDTSASDISQPIPLRTMTLRYGPMNNEPSEIGSLFVV